MLRSHVIHRARHYKFMDMHNLLVVTCVKSMKRSLMEDAAPVLATRASVTPTLHDPHVHAKDKAGPATLTYS